MEESIGYEALFSSDEWESLTFGSWDDPDLDPYDLSSLSGVVTIDGEGCAAPSQAASSEGNHSHSIGPSLDTRAATSCDQECQDQGSDEDVIRLEFVHEVNCRERQLDDGTTEYVLECDICEEIGTADGYEEADVIAQQHKTMTSELWEVNRSE